MAYVTRQTHDACIAMKTAIKARDPALHAKAMARGVFIPIGSPEHKISGDITALDSVALAFALGERPSAKHVKRATALMAEGAA